jgi:hypothetical protein
MKAKIDYSKLSVLTVLLFMWQLPQIIASLLLMAVIHKGVTKYTNEHSGMTVWRVNHPFKACWSLGAYVFIPGEQPERILRHETGHSIQSMIFGPVYRFAVGIPSVILFITRRVKKKDEKWYYSHYPENWANRLGGVTDIDNKE